tara:strand:+ start:52 stop:465 length:414 start_codon:yes stop_codon:yes gene_type:complete
MILGVGIDLASTQFWVEAINDPTTSVIEGTFTERERRDAEAGPVPAAERYAARFAAKEAFTKAVSSARRGQPPLIDRLAPIEVEIIKDEWGRPSLNLYGDAAMLAAEIGVTQSWVSLSHEEGHTVAVVILEGGDSNT